MFSCRRILLTAVLLPIGQERIESRLGDEASSSDGRRDETRRDETVHDKLGTSMMVTRPEEAATPTVRLRLFPGRRSRVLVGLLNAGDEGCMKSGHHLLYDIPVSAPHPFSLSPVSYFRLFGVYVLSSCKSGARSRGGRGRGRSTKRLGINPLCYLI